MDWTNLFGKSKELSSLQLEKPDITYQVWELGRILGSAVAIFWQIKNSSNKEIKEKGNPELFMNARDLLGNIEYIHKKVCRDTNKDLSDTTKLEVLVENLVKENTVDVKFAHFESILRIINKWHTQILYELRAKSIHLSNIFSFSYGLKNLQVNSMYDIDSDNIEELVNDNIENLEKLKCGDKILTSPNLEITPQNLKIIKSWLTEIQNHISLLRGFAKKDINIYIKKMDKKFEVIESLILDMKNPSDYISGKRKMINNMVPFIASYYIAIIPVALFLDLDKSSGSILDDALVISFLSGFIPIYLSLIWRVFHYLKDRLEVSSLKFGFSRFNVE